MRNKIIGLNLVGTVREHSLQKGRDQEGVEEDALISLFGDDILSSRNTTKYIISNTRLSRAEMLVRQLEVLRLIRIKKPNHTPRSPRVSEKFTKHSFKK